MADLIIHVSQDTPDQMQLLNYYNVCAFRMCIRLFIAFPIRIFRIKAFISIFIFTNEAALSKWIAYIVYCTDQ